MGEFSKTLYEQMVLRGPFVISFRDPDDHTISERAELRALGDYVIWREVLEHRWYAEKDSLVLTVRWSPRTI